MRGRHIVLRLLPVLIPFTLLFLGGAAFALLQSLGIMIPVPAEDAPGEAYRRLLASRWFYASFGFSLYVAFLSAGLATVCGTLLAYRIWRLPLGTQRLAIVYKLPLVLPHIAVAFIVLILFSRTGLVSAVLRQLGVIGGQEDFPSILYGGSGLGLVIAYVYKEVPFVVLLVSAVLKKLDVRHLHTARMLGASRVATFFRVVVPFLLPVVNTTFIILFLYSFGAFDIPSILSESRPQMLSITVFNLYFKRDIANRPDAMAILVLMFLFSSLFIYLYSRLVARLEVAGRKI